MKISKITVGRLYNLGNYEHVRYEITAEIKEGESAATTIKGVEAVLAGLSPVEKAGIVSKSDIERRTREIEEMRTMPAADWERRYGHCVGKVAEVIGRYEESLEEDVAKRDAVLKRAREARELFDDLGGAAEWKDAKLSWHDDDEDDYPV